jgi:hypothetical protein
LSALFITVYALNFSHFYEKDPAVSPIFDTVGTVGGTFIYTVILLFALLLIYDSLAKTHEQWHGWIFGTYYLVLLITFLDVLNDVFIVFLPTLYLYFSDVTALTILFFAQGAGVLVGLHIMSMANFQVKTRAQRFAVDALIWPVKLIKVYRRRPS